MAQWRVIGKRGGETVQLRVQDLGIQQITHFVAMLAKYSGAV